MTMAVSVLVVLAFAGRPEVHGTGPALAHRGSYVADGETLDLQDVDPGLGEARVRAPADHDSGDRIDAESLQHAGVVATTLAGVAGGVLDAHTGVVVGFDDVEPGGAPVVGATAGIEPSGVRTGNADFHRVTSSRLHVFASSRLHVRVLAA